MKPFNALCWIQTKKKTCGLEKREKNFKQKSTVIGISPTNTKNGVAHTNAGLVLNNYCRNTALNSTPFEELLCVAVS